MKIMTLDKKKSLIAQVKRVWTILIIVKDAYRNLIWRFSNNCLIVIFWVDNFAISIENIILIDYELQIVFRISTITHC